VTPTTTTTTTTPTASSSHVRPWLILAVVALAQLMVVLDATIVNIALPSAQDALGFSDASRQWIITAYALSFGSLLLLGGRICDFFGRKWTFIAGLSGFAVASAVGGLAQSFEVLVAARAAQGAFGALLAPAALSLLSTTFTDPGERGKAFGIYGAIAGGGGAVGLLLGGVLTEYLSWRWCLYVNLGFAIPAAIGGLIVLQRHAATSQAKLDVPGTLTAVSGLVALVYGLTKAETDGWGAGVTLGLLVAAAVLLTSFVLIERRSAHPLLPLRVVLDRNRGGAFAAVGLVGAGMFGVFLFLTYYLQQTLRFTPIETGLAFLPMVGALMLTATTTSAAVLPRVGPKPLVTAGMLLAAVGMLLLTQVGVDSTYAAHVLPGLLVMGVGLGLAMATAMGTATLGVRPEDASVASATVNTMQQIGGSVGTALLSTLAASATSSFASSHATATDAMARAAVHGYTTAFWWSAAIFAAGAIICGLLMRPGTPQLDPAAEPVLAH
jgi:EmrB/QacA subfamily drug resistance transporter